MKKAFCENARQVGAHLSRTVSRNWPGRHEIIGNVDGSGLFWGLDLVRLIARPDSRSSREAPGGSSLHFVTRGFWMGTTGNHGNVLKLRPPLPFSRENADQALEVLDRCLGEVRPG